MSARTKHNPYFLAREADGSVRIRVRFDGTEAALMEEAAADGKVLDWIHKTLQEGARRDIAAARASRPVAPPPVGID